MTDIFAPKVLEGKVAFLAGATSGINLAIAERYAREGAKVFDMSRSPEKVATAVEGLKALGAEAGGAPADVRDVEAVTGALKECHTLFGDIDIVVSGAAGNFVAPALGMSTNAFKAVVDIDLLGTFNVLRSCFEFLNKKSASLINITAPQAVQAQVFQAHVCAAKAGIDMLTKCLALDWGQFNVRVNGICPGPIADTEGMERLAPTQAHLDRIALALAAGRMGTKQEIADCAVFLATEASAYITGTIINVDGGITAGDATAARKGLGDFA